MKKLYPPPVSIKKTINDTDIIQPRKQHFIMSSKIFYVVLQRCLPVLMINGLYIMVGGNGKK